MKIFITYLSIIVASIFFSIGAAFLYFHEIWFEETSTGAALLGIGGPILMCLSVMLILNVIPSHQCP